MEETTMPVIPSNWADSVLQKSTVTLCDGTVLDGYAQRPTIADEIWIFPQDEKLNLIELVQMFSDSEKTSRIETFTPPDSRAVYEGYTHLMTINSNLDGTFTIRLGRPIN